MKKVVIAIFLFFASYSHAEHCWMTGACLNEVRYIVVPESHYKYTDGETVNIYGKTYLVDAKNKIFLENGVPEVGHVYTINTNYYELLGAYRLDDDITTIAKWFETHKPLEQQWNEKKASGMIKVLVTQFGVGDQMLHGTKVKVLGVDLLKREIPEMTAQHLLLTVQVVAEPKN